MTSTDTDNRPADLPARVLAETDYADAPLGVDGVEIGQHVAVHSRGRVREGVITKIGKTRVTVTYTTEGAIETAHKIASIDEVVRAEGERKYQGEMAAKYRATADRIEAGTEAAPNYEPDPAKAAAQLREWADTAETKAQDTTRVEQAKIDQARPYAERFVEAINVTNKTVPADQVYALVDGGVR